MKSIITTLFLLLSLNIYSQTNLVYNGDFETKYSCPKGISQMFLAVKWEQATAATSDYYNGCYEAINSDVSVPYNWRGYNPSHSGRAYAGLYDYSFMDYREYIYTDWEQPLKAGRYWFEMWLCLSEKSNLATKSVGAVFLDTFNAHNYIDYFNVLPFTPQILPQQHIKSNWTKVGGYINIKGTEKFLIIGNFFTQDTMEKYQDWEIVNNNDPTSRFDSYMLIDDVALYYCGDFTQPNLGSDTSLCAGDSLILDPNITNVSYLWDDNSTFHSKLITKPGTYNVTISDGYCVSSDTITVNFIPKPNIKFPTDVLFDCFNGDKSDIYLKVDSTYDSYLWSDSSTSYKTYINKPGKYWVKGWDRFCSNIDTIDIVKLNTPQFSLGNDTSYCGSTTLISPNPPNTRLYLWNNNSENKSITVDTSGLYWLKITDQMGCYNIDTINITINKPPIINLSHQITICNPDTVIYPGHFNSYLWNDGSTDSTYRIRKYDLYNVTVKDSNNCVASSNVEVVNGCDFSIYIPNAFYPNSNIEVNRKFSIVSEKAQSIKLTVYNRWGQEIYVETSPEISWDGTSNGIECQQDVYIYYIFAIDNKNKAYKYSGSVTLLR
jgi:gliding motility-associated-like protein